MLLTWSSKQNITLILVNRAVPARPGSPHRPCSLHQATPHQSPSLVLQLGSPNVQHIFFIRVSFFANIPQISRNRHKVNPIENIRVVPYYSFDTQNKSCFSFWWIMLYLPVLVLHVVIVRFIRKHLISSHLLCNNLIQITRDIFFLYVFPFSWKLLRS